MPDPEQPQVIKECHAPAATEALAAEFAARLAPGSWVGLIGPLGAGKSVFARAVGRAWGVAGPMPSPTFTLMAAHEGRCPIYHIDLYRVATEDEFSFAGLAPYFVGDGICLVEWADRLRAVWPPAGWMVTIEIMGATARRIAIESFSPDSGQRRSR